MKLQKKQSFERDSDLPCITLPDGIAQNDYDIHKIISIIPMIKIKNYNEISAFK